MMRSAIRDFSRQFSFEPRIENAGSFQASLTNPIIVAGMGGSALAGDIVKALNPKRNITVWRDYNLPPHVSGVSGSASFTPLVIASSYSGNTEETLSSFFAASAAGLPVVAIATGGKLLDGARAGGTPYIQLPDTGVQPRSALGLSLRALLKAMGDEHALAETAPLARTLDPVAFEHEGKELAQRLRGYVPVIYASNRNGIIAYNWKIKLNETGKVPAFCNVFPELNHNEMTGFDGTGSTPQLTRAFGFIFLRDDNDHPRIKTRMDITAQLLMNRKLPVEESIVRGDSPYERLFSSLLIADWTALYTGEHYGVETEQVPMVEEMKKLIA